MGRRIPVWLSFLLGGMVFAVVVDDVLDTLADGLNRLATKAEYVVDDNSGNIYALTLNLRTISENLKVMSADIKEHPWKLVNLFGKAEESSSSSAVAPDRRVEVELRRDGGLGRPAGR